jgi:hypothetical protein
MILVNPNQEIEWVTVQINCKDEDVIKDAFYLEDAPKEPIGKFEWSKIEWRGMDKQTAINYLWGSRIEDLEEKVEDLMDEDGMTLTYRATVFSDRYAELVKFLKETRGLVEYEERELTDEEIYGPGRWRQHCITIGRAVIMKDTDTVCPMCGDPDCYSK